MDNKLEEREEKTFRAFLHLLNEEAFISSTDSVTGETVEFADAVEDREATIAISGEYDTEALKKALLTFLASERAQVVKEMREATEKLVKRHPAVLTTQGFTSPTCRSCGQKFSWHNGNPPDICKNCGERYSTDGFNAGIAAALEALSRIGQEHD